MSKRTNSLFIRHVPDGTRPEDLRELFERYGYVREIYIPSDYLTRRPRGFAFVDFDDIRDAEDALHGLHKHRFRGRDLEIEFAQGGRKSSDEMRNKYGEMDSRGGGYDRGYDRGYERDRYGGGDRYGDRGGGGRYGGYRGGGYRGGGYDRRERRRSRSYERRSRSPMERRRSRSRSPRESRRKSRRSPTRSPTPQSPARRSVERSASPEGSPRGGGNDGSPARHSSSPRQIGGEAHRNGDY